ncbi:MAG TPA: hypothetical protein VE685_21290 [Thermoanaerobaculia bacterium]|nr:hypothetical protein [Thermoanaerobaculia bacterium]
MRIHDFRLRLVSRGEQSILFEALRRLTLLEDPQRMVVASSDDDDDDGDAARPPGWMVWTEVSPDGGSRPQAIAEAV